MPGLLLERLGHRIHAAPGGKGSVESFLRRIQVVYDQQRLAAFGDKQALLYFMEARRELPDEAFIPARIVLDDNAFDRVVDLLEKPAQPTAALCELMRGKGR